VSIGEFGKIVSDTFKFSPTDLPHCDNQPYSLPVPEIVIRNQLKTASKRTYQNEFTAMQ